MERITMIFVVLNRFVAEDQLLPLCRSTDSLVQVRRGEEERREER